MRQRTLFIALAVVCLVIVTLAPAIRRAKARAQRQTCAQNLRHLALAWTRCVNEHSNVAPTSVLSLNNLGREPKLFICPSDKSRQNVNTWEDLVAKGSSYACEACVLSPVRPMPLDQAQNHIILRCTLHDNVALADGSVHQGTRFLTNLVQAAIPLR